MRARRWLAGWAALGLIGGCDEMPNAQLVNNSGADVELVERAGADGARALRIPAGATSKRVVAYGAGRRFDIVAGGCVYGYAFPPMGVNFAWRSPDGSAPDYDSGYPIRAQLDRDFLIYLAPSKARVPAPRSELLASQAHGFPLRPMSKTCRPPAG